jgi:hypothetical protein
MNATEQHPETIARMKSMEGKSAVTGTFSGEIAEREVVFPRHMGSFVQFVAYAEVDSEPSTSVTEKKDNTDTERVSRRPARLFKG